MFATTGVDGIHFSLLTDFGRITNLNEAPVLCVSPMDFGDGIRIVAKNIRDFFALHFSGHDSWFYNQFQTKEDYLQFWRRENDNVADPYVMRWREQKAKIREKAIQDFKFSLIQDPFSYIQEVCSERRKNIVLQTAEGLGVAPLIKRNAYTPHPWSLKEIPEHEFGVIKEFVQEAEIETLLSFIRDCQVQYIEHIELIQLLYKKLMEYGLLEEALRWMNGMNVTNSPKTNL